MSISPIIKAHNKSQIHEKGARGQPLSDQQKDSNTTKSKTRASVAHVFGFMTHSMNDALPMRQIGQQRIQSCLTDATFLTCNRKRNCHY